MCSVGALALVSLGRISIAASSSCVIVPTSSVLIFQLDDVPLVQRLDLVGDGVELFALAAEDHVGDG